ncbi:MAG: Mu-like prophage major head subunit gpT family protein [Deltaproteobacteria bacterium]|nr:Mu-like prophage major head subunit gpT family protein [Deltaproteobacteria bacterium]
MEITPQNLQALFNVYDLSFQQGLTAEQKLFWDKIATQRPSNTRQTTYAWMAKLPTLREWVGERVVNAISSYSYTIVNKDFELTMELDRNDILDDTYGLFNPVAEEMGRAARKWPDQLMAKLVAVGETTLCYDGQNFFDVDHPIDKYEPTLGVQKNLFKSLPLIPDNYQAVRTEMQTYKGEDGQVLGVNPNLLVVPPQLEQRALQILHADFIAPQSFAGQVQVGTNTNILKGTADLLVIPQLASDPNAWYLLDTTRAVRPFIFQLRQSPQFVQFTDPKSEGVFRRKKFVYGVDARGNAGFGLWFLAAKATAAA